MDSYHLVSRIGQGLPRLPFRQLPNTMHTRASSAQAALQLNLELFESDLPDPQQTLDPEPNPGFGKLPLELRYVRSIGLRPSLYLDEIGPANDFEQINDLATLLPTTTQGSFHGSPLLGRHIPTRMAASSTAQKHNRPYHTIHLPGKSI